MGSSGIYARKLLLFQSAENAPGQPLYLLGLFFHYQQDTWAHRHHYDDKRLGPDAYTTYNTPFGHARPGHQPDRSNATLRLDCSSCSAKLFFCLSKSSGFGFLLSPQLVHHPVRSQGHGRSHVSRLQLKRFAKLFSAGRSRDGVIARDQSLVLPSSPSAFAAASNFSPAFTRLAKLFCLRLGQLVGSLPASNRRHLLVNFFQRALMRRSDLFTDKTTNPRSVRIGKLSSPCLNRKSHP